MFARMHRAAVCTGLAAGLLAVAATLLRAPPAGGLVDLPVALPALTAGTPAETGIQAPSAETARPVARRAITLAPGQSLIGALVAEGIERVQARRVAAALDGIEAGARVRQG
jgi:hypothetical protein